MCDVPAGDVLVDGVLVDGLHGSVLVNLRVGVCLGAWQKAR